MNKLFKPLLRALLRPPPKPLRPGCARLAVFFTACWLVAFPATALEPAAAKVVLSVRGKITEKNSALGAEFDMAMLQKLPQRTFTTKTPWDKYPIKFTGPYLRDVLAPIGVVGTTIKAVAINDYTESFPLSDTQNFNVILALKMNGRPISVRTRGPLFIVYPFDADPALKSQLYAARSVWQVRTLHIE